MKFAKVPALLLSLALGACGGSSQPATSTTTPAKTAQAADDPSCPISVAGTSVTVEDTTNGAALVFVTTSDVAEVRRRAAALAAMHNDHHGKMGPLPDGSDTGRGHAGHDTSGHAGHETSGHAGHDTSGHAGHDTRGHAGHDTSGHAGHDTRGQAGHAMHGGGDHAGHAGGMIGVHSKATASDIEGGAKVSFVANGADVAKLQNELRMHAHHLAAGTCAMGSS